jgi:predicted AAA+ superfamily ATPase
LESSKIVILYGARQVGKTTLAKAVISQLKLKTLSINADQQKYIDVFSSRDLGKMKSILSGYELFFLDEAQRIPDIGINLKILADEMPELKIIATGSSSFNLSGKISEPLTGRVWTYSLYPVGFCELGGLFNRTEIDDKLEECLIYGNYPEVFTTQNYCKKQKLLEEISRSYLFRDVLELATVKHSNKVRDLLKLLAFQIGSEVSVFELAGALGLSREAVDRYIDLLEKSFVIFRLKGFSRNLRKEISKMDKIFFYDLGIRNSLIDNFKPIKDRDDIGKLWENFLIIERRKMSAYRSIYMTSYFWRTYTGAELDYIEDKDGNLYGYEFKYKAGRTRPPNSWLENYSNASFQAVNRGNYLDFIM